MSGDGLIAFSIGRSGAPKLNADGTHDDTAALQAMINDGGNLFLGQFSFLISAPLVIPTHNFHLDGGGATLEYTGAGAAIDFALVGGVYPVECSISRLRINVNAAGAVGVSTKATHATLQQVNVTLRNTASNAVGFDLVGDEANGSGPYYNSFINCCVQGQGSGQTGVRFSCTTPYYRAPNANTWIGGRVGQCNIGFDINGCGNALLNPTAEGCSIPFNLDRATKCSVYPSYIENADVAFNLTANSQANKVGWGYNTGVVKMVNDIGTGNIVDHPP